MIEVKESGGNPNTSDRTEWLSWRSTGIGGSEAGAVMGVSPYETALSVYLKKIGLISKTVENEAMKWGLRLEPVIAEEYSQRTGYKFTGEQICVRSPTHSFMLATLDRVRSDGRIVELKTVGYRNSSQWGESGGDEIPQHYLIQCMHQLVCTGTEIVDVAALIGGQELRIYHINRDDRVADHLIAAESEFWGRVTRREPPPVDPARDAAAMSRLWPHAEGEIDLGPIGRTLVEEWEEHGREARRHGNARKRCRVALLDILQDCASARIGDGRVLTRKVIRVSEKQIIRNSYEFVDLRVSKSSRG